MLILSRRIGDKLIISDNIEISVNRIDGFKVSLGIHAPKNVKIIRAEQFDNYDYERKALPAKVDD